MTEKPPETEHEKRIQAVRNLGNSHDNCSIEHDEFWLEVNNIMTWIDLRMGKLREDIINHETDE